MVYETVYSWKIDKYPVSAQIAGETIADIKNKSEKGCIEPEDLLEASKLETAPLHCCFEWNDSIAAEKFRVNQARDIINNLTISIVNASSNITTVRAFVSVAKSNSKGKFVEIQSALEKKEYRETILSNALAELQNFKSKYKTLSELYKVFAAIDEVAETFNNARS